MNENEQKVGTKEIQKKKGRVNIKKGKKTEKKKKKLLKTEGNKKRNRSKKKENEEREGKGKNVRYSSPFSKKNHVFRRFLVKYYHIKC